MAGEAELLRGTTVVDLTTTIPGPYCTQLLRRLGARVIQFEPPGGDPTRDLPHLHRALCAGKESVVVDLKDPRDVALVLAVARRADVLVEGWRPGVADRLGLGAERVLALNPRIVYCSISGYGATGQLRDRAGHDLNYVAQSGMLRALFGDRPPQELEVPLADLAGGTFAALRILAALASVRGGGRGLHLDTSLAGGVRDWVEALGGREADRPVAGLLGLPHYGAFQTADDEVLTLGTVFEDHLWRGLCEALGLSEWAGLGFAERVARAEELRGRIAKAVRSRPRAHWEAALRRVDTCWAFAERPTRSAGVEGMLPPPEGEPPALGEHTEAVRQAFAPQPSPGAGGPGAQ